MDKLKDNLTSRREIAHLFSYKASEASETSEKRFTFYTLKK